MIKKILHTNFTSQRFYTEGPVIDESGNLFFTTLSGGEIIKKTAKGQNSVWAKTDCPNGQVILKGGDHLVCDSKLGALIRFDVEGNYVGKDIDGFCAGEIIRVPNDVIVDKNGNVYFTDSVRHTGKVGFISAAGEEKIIGKNLDYPNGLALSKDEKTLYIAESYKNRIIAFDLDRKEFTSRNFRIISNLPKHASGKKIQNLPDGIKTDADGNIWVAHYGMGMVHIVSEKGKILQSISTTIDLTSNLFIKKNRLIITGGFGEPGPGAIIEMKWK